MDAHTVVYFTCFRPNACAHARIKSTRLANQAVLYQQIRNNYYIDIYQTAVNNRGWLLGIKNNHE